MPDPGQGLSESEDEGPPSVAEGSGKEMGHPGEDAGGAEDSDSGGEECDEEDALGLSDDELDVILAEDAPDEEWDKTSRFHGRMCGQGIIWFEWNCLNWQMMMLVLLVTYV
eukprot:12427101-Karenia_brevis.AAC.1